MGGFLDLQNTLILLALSANFFFVVLVVVRNPNPDKSSKFFIAGAASVVLWNFAMLLYRNTYDPTYLKFFSRTLYAVAALIPCFFALFAFYFNHRLHVSKFLLYTTIGTIFPIIAICIVPGGLIIDAMRDPAMMEPHITFNRFFSVLYGLYHVTFFDMAFAILIHAYFHIQEEIRRKQLVYVLLGTSVACGIALVTNLYLPFVGVFEYNWLGQAGSVSMIAFISFAILQYKLFDIQTTATQLFVFILSSFLFIRIFSSVSENESTIDIVVFLLSLCFGYLLIRGVKQEVKQREEIDKLAKRLSETNWELSRKNEQLRIIDQRKSEFVSIVSHQLRTPVTAIKGYSSLILENAFGEVPQAIREPIEKIFVSSNRLAGMINDFLNISKIEQGTMTYNFSSVDLGKMLNELVEEFTVSAGKKKIDLTLTMPENETFLVTADEGKIRQILSNLIDNAIKYTPMGKVHITIERSSDHSRVIVKVTDSGIGLSQDDIQHLFGKFSRGAHGQKVFTDGSGLGLYVAKKMLEAHKGRIWVDSPGIGKGSTFAVELLAEDLPQGK
jgi:signal transduction histidine kinase